MGAGYVQFAAFVEAGGQKNGVEVLPEPVESDVAPDGYARVQRDAHRQDVVDFHLDDFARKTKLRDA